MTHEEIQILVSAYADGQVTPEEKTIVEEHLKSCSTCQKDLSNYKTISSSLSKWSDETLSPDEALNVQKNLETRRDTMFTKRSLGALVGTLCILLVVGSVTQSYLKRGHVASARLVSASDDIADQYAAPDYIKAETSRVRSAFFARSAMHDVNAPVAMSMANLAQPAGMPMASSMAATDSSTYYGTQEDRKKIERADITLKVDNAFKTKSQLTDLVSQFNGIVMESEFNRSTDGSGHGSLTCKVYPKDLENALKKIRNLGQVQEEVESSTDVTDQYTDAQDSKTKYTVERIRLEKQLNDFKLFSPTTDEQKVEIQAKIDQTEQEIAALDSEIKSYQEQTSMSVIVVNYYDTYQNPVKADDTSNQWKSNLENKWKVTLSSSVDTFTSIFFGIIILLSYIVPVLIWCVIIGIVYLVIRLFIKK